MIVTRFFLPFELPTLNELEHARGQIAVARGSGDRTRWNRYNEIKRRLQADIVAHVISQRVPKISDPGPFRVTFRWHCSDRRSDPDNIAAGGRKIIMDALARHRPAAGDRTGVSAGIIHCDGWHCVVGFVDIFLSPCAPSARGVHVAIEAV